MTLFSLAFMAMQINVEYENGGFLSPSFLYCSALSKPVTENWIILFIERVHITIYKFYLQQLNVLYWNKNNVVKTALTHLEADFVWKFFRVLICWTCNNGGSVGGGRSRRIRRRGQGRDRKYVRQTVQPVQAGQIRVRFGVHWCWKHGDRSLDVQHGLLKRRNGERYISVGCFFFFRVHLFFTFVLYLSKI